jgi:hypothetical protein
MFATLAYFPVSFAVGSDFPPAAAAALFDTFSIQNLKFPLPFTCV